MTPAAGSNFSRYVIPDDLDPSGICCLSVPVPDDPQWRAMFYGAIWRLSLQTNWERDAAHSAKVVAAKWREIWSEAQTMGCCNNDPSQLNLQISNYLTQNMQMAFTWTQVWIQGTQTISADYYQIPDTYSTDAADAGDEIFQRTQALCIAVQGFLNEVMNYMESWLISNFDEVATVAGGTLVALGSAAGIVYWPVLLGFATAAVIAKDVFLELRRSEYREYLICRMFENLEGKDPDLRSDFEAGLTADTVGRPTPQTPTQDIARDIIEAYLRSQLNNLDNYLMFAGQMGTAMDIASSGDIECPCTDFTHIFDFEIDDQGWTNSAADARPFGVYQAGVGWVSVFNAIITPLAEKLYTTLDGFDTRTITSIQAQWETTGSGVPGRQAGVLVLLGAAVIDVATLDNFDVPGAPTLTWTGSESCDKINTSMVSANATDDSQWILKKVIVTGIGTDPF